MLPTQNELKKLLNYDPLTGILTWKPRSNKSWNTRYAGKEAFTALDRKGYRVGGIFNKTHRAARVIYKWWHGTDPDQVDHIDGNKTNNRINNLRDVCSQDNQKNMKRFSTNNSGFTGVCWAKSKNKWQANITVNGKLIFLGRFKDIKEAIDARKKAELKYGFHPNHGR